MWIPLGSHCNSSWSFCTNAMIIPWSKPILLSGINKVNPWECRGSNQLQNLTAPVAVLWILKMSMPVTMYTLLLNIAHCGGRNTNAITGESACYFCGPSRGQSDLAFFIYISWSTTRPEAPKGLFLNLYLAPIEKCSVKGRFVLVLLQRTLHLHSRRHWSSPPYPLHPVTGVTIEHAFYPISLVWKSENIFHLKNGKPLET